MNTDRRDFIALGIGALAVAVIPASIRRRPALVRRRIPVMGTVAEVAIPTRQEAWAHRAIDAAFAELRRVEATMSRFLVDSDVGVLNAAGEGWVPVSEDTAEVLARALEWASRSGGRFDPCLGRASELWDVTRRDRPPSGACVDGFASLELWRALEVEASGGNPRARLHHTAAAIDLGGIAKGFAVDAASDAMRRFGAIDGLVNVGGDLVAMGADASDEPWRVGVRSPESPLAIVSELTLTDAAVATSGDYLRFFHHAGRRYHHLLDPTTAAPRRTPTRSLTVRAARCIDADAAATTLFGASTDAVSGIVGEFEDDLRIIHHLQEVTS